MTDEYEIPVPASKEPRPMTVGELTRIIKRKLETEIGRVEVEGEISNWSVSSRGHAYFAMKDGSAILSCVIFQGARSRLNFSPEDGARVVAVGQVSVYEARGQYQLLVSGMRQTGLGDLFKRFMELKERLELEGLFGEERKKPLPAMPRRIGVVTSPTGAALRDILNVIRRRFPCVEIIISPTEVQGDNAPPMIVRAIQKLNRFSRRQEESGGQAVDVMIVARGGGSIEDLWAFNDERVARAIFASAIPVISAVGHETDFTIADFVADRRAPTPSAAAEIVVAEIKGLNDQLVRLEQQLLRSLMHLLNTRRLELQHLTRSWGLRQPLDLVRQAIQRLDDLTTRTLKALSSAVVEARHHLRNLEGQLDALNPTAVLARGYSIVTRARDGRVVMNSRQVKIADHLKIRLSEGEIRATVLPQGEDMFEGME